MKDYIGTKTLRATPMTRGEYTKLRDWPSIADENPADDGYLVEYTDGGAPNHPDYAGYISWSPKDVFEAAYVQLNDSDEPMLQFFAWSHLPPALASVSKPFSWLAGIIVNTLPRNPERTVALRKLLEAKDCAVRSKLYKP